MVLPLLVLHIVLCLPFGGVAESNYPSAVVSSTLLAISEHASPQTMLHIKLYLPCYRVTMLQQRTQKRGRAQARRPPCVTSFLELSEHPGLTTVDETGRAHRRLPGRCYRQKLNIWRVVLHYARFPFPRPVARHVPSRYTPSPSLAPTAQTPLL